MAPLTCASKPLIIDRQHIFLHDFWMRGPPSNTAEGKEDTPKDNPFVATDGLPSGKTVLLCGSLSCLLKFDVDTLYR